MSDTDSKPEQTASSERPDGKREYTRPAIVARETLEAVATTCEPIGIAKGSPGTCPLGPISS